MKTKTVKREGFWKSKAEPTLPKPKPRTKPWVGRKEFLKAMCRLEYRLKPKYYKGQSKCRVCDKNNGYGEYEFKEFVWPTGLYHYVKAHNVKPSSEFIAFVFREQSK